MVIVRAKVVFETVLIPKPEMYVVYTGEWNPGEIYQIKRCWTNDTYCDLINHEIKVHKEILSVPLHEMKVPHAELEIDAHSTELNRDGFFKKYRVIKIPFAPEDFKYIVEKSLQEKEIDVIVDVDPHTLKYAETASVYHPTVDFKLIPYEYHAALLDIVDIATTTSYIKGYNGTTTQEFYDWFREEFKQLQ